MSREFAHQWPELLDLTPNEIQMHCCNHLRHSHFDHPEYHLNSDSFISSVPSYDTIQISRAQALKQKKHYGAI
jgi:GH43 family beta-xylosidase